MLSNINSLIPDDSTSIRFGSNRHSGASNLSLPTLMTVPSGNLYSLSTTVVSCANFLSLFRSNDT